MTSARDFAQYDNDHPEVWEMFERFALDAHRSGHATYSADAVLHRVRWECGVVRRSATWKCNNNLTAYYARKFHAAHPILRGFFRTRASVADAA